MDRSTLCSGSSQSHNPSQAPKSALSVTPTVPKQQMGGNDSDNEEEESDEDSDENGSEWDSDEDGSEWDSDEENGSMRGGKRLATDLVALSSNKLVEIQRFNMRTEDCTTINGLADYNSNQEELFTGHLEMFKARN
ncbi:hypothetical protein L218DRAFT_1008258 [Marasmius fiardii PR-910]|nr:hypothetical protein L218DRAFT_1008258 [Marasmius fiardii PR-910]